MRPRDVEVLLVERSSLAEDAQVLRFESRGEPVSFRAGQFVMLRVPGAGLLRRPYSLCDRSSEGGFTLLVKVIGLGTGALAGLPLGATASCLGPLGTCFEAPASEATPVVVAGGVGIAPFVAFCRGLAEAGRRAIVLLGGRRERDLYLRDAFADFGMDVRCATEDGSFGYRGLVTALLPKALEDAGLPFVYSCGPTPMLVRVAEMAEEAGMPHQVSIERRMGCGMGCCLGCVVWASPEEGGRPEYLRSCSEGPVFDAARIVWDQDPHPL